MQKEMGEIVGVDIIRIICAISVMVYHLGFWNIFSKYDEVTKILSNNKIGVAVAPVCYFGWVGVEIFFVISGYVISFSASNSKLANFLWRRFLRIWPAIWICAPISALCIIYVDGIGIKTASIAVIKSVVLTPKGGWVDGSYWSLPIELVFYLQISLFLLFNLQKRLLALATGIGLASVLFWSMYMLSFFDNPSEPVVLKPFYLLTSVRHGCFFALGMVIRSILNREKKFILIILAIVFFLAGIFEIYSNNAIREIQTNTSMPVAKPIMFFSIAVFLIVLSTVYNAHLRSWLGPDGCRLARVAGLVSYPLYLIHRPIALAVMKVLTNVIGLEAYCAWVGALLAAIVFAAGIALWVEPYVRRTARSLILRLVPQKVLAHPE